jgi:C4-dicarboxylate transporter
MLVSLMIVSAAGLGAVLLAITLWRMVCRFMQPHRYL